MELVGEPSTNIRHRLLGGKARLCGLINKWEVRDRDSRVNISRGFQMKVSQVEVI